MNYLSSRLCLSYQNYSKKSTFALNGFIDWHSHILPGVDDGVSTMDESIEILSKYEESGVSEIWLTPHIMEDIPNQTAALKTRFSELQQAYSGRISLYLASENMIDNLFRERLAANDLLPMGSDHRMLLIETSYFSSPIRFHETINEIKSKGFYPLLAHPERYNYMDSESDYRELKKMGVLFQLNAMSLCGYYGPVVKKESGGTSRKGDV